MISEPGATLDDPSERYLRAAFEPLERGRYRARGAVSPDDLREVRRFRSACFGEKTGQDADPVDAACLHVMIETTAGGLLVCAFRLRLVDRNNLPDSYSARFYDLRSLRQYPEGMMEIGRFCTRAGDNDPDILRLAWAVITRCVDAAGLGLLFGCSSFRGTDPAPYRAAFSYLSRYHAAPRRWAPGRGAAEHVDFAACEAASADPMTALRQLPPLLRSYLGMGAWVSGHAVIDRTLGTLHVFTGLEIARIPQSRKQLLRAL